jgi:hypothetical protein
MEAGAVRVRRSAGIVRIAGERAEKIEGDTKSSKPRAVDVDAETIAVWRAPMVTMTVYAHVVSEGGLEPPSWWCIPESGISHPSKVTRRRSLRPAIRDAS